MKYLFLVLVFCTVSTAQVGMPLGGCKAQEVWVPDGGQSCEWVFTNPNYEFICYETGSCMCNPWPQEDGGHSTPTDPLERLRQILRRSPVPASMISYSMKERLKVPATVAKSAKEPEKESAPK